LRSTFPAKRDKFNKHRIMKNNKTRWMISLTGSCLGFFLMMITWVGGFTQTVSINTTGAAPNSSAGLDLDFTNLGLLIPRIALTGTESSLPLTANVAGMMVYNTSFTGNVQPGFYNNNGVRWATTVPPAGFNTGDMQYWNGTSWINLPAGQPGQYLQVSSTNVPSWAGAGFASLTTTLPTAITTTTATSGGVVSTDAGIAVTARGVCWSTSINPTVALTTKTTDGSGTGTFSSSVTGLITGTVYYLRAYATNATGTVYGSQTMFMTQ
jgi:hypothetical protein